MILHFEDPGQVRFELMHSLNAGFHGDFFVIAMNVHYKSGIRIESHRDPITKGNLDSSLRNSFPLPDNHLHNS